MVRWNSVRMVGGESTGHCYDATQNQDAISADTGAMVIHTGISSGGFAVIGVLYGCRPGFTKAPTGGLLLMESATARDGQPYANTYAWFLTMQDERFVEAFAFFDSVEFNEFWTRVTPGA